MLDERKAAILRAVVEEYIQTGQPVGSGHVARAPGVDVSSATVRNEMGLLESEGFLRQPHTSAGRVPTEKGYRFFVDHLRRPARLATSSAEEVRAFFARAHGEVEQMLSETSRLLSDLTHLTSVVVAPAAIETTVRSVQLVGLSTTSAVLVAVLSDGSVEKHSIDLPPGVGRRAGGDGRRAHDRPPRRRRPRGPARGSRHRRRPHGLAGRAGARGPRPSSGG